MQEPDTNAFHSNHVPLQSAGPLSQVSFFNEDDLIEHELITLDSNDELSKCLQPAPGALAQYSSNNRKTPITREQRRYCGTIIKDLKKHRDSAPFLAPVDPVILNIPDYPSIIKKPMDLGTIEQKLNNLEYETVDDFANDMNLIFSNCYLYNGTEAPVSQCASNLEKAFNKLLHRMPGEVRRDRHVHPKRSTNGLLRSNKARHLVVLVGLEAFCGAYVCKGYPQESICV